MYTGLGWGGKARAGGFQDGATSKCGAAVRVERVNERWHC